MYYCVILHVKCIVCQFCLSSLSFSAARICWGLRINSNLCNYFDLSNWMAFFYCLFEAPQREEGLARCNLLRIIVE